MGFMAASDGRKRVCSAVEGISALVRHGVPAKRSAARSRASRTRSATSRLGSMNWRSAISSRLDDRATVTFMSMRSSNGPESLPR